MDKKKTNIFDEIEKLKPVDPKALENFKRTMTEEVIPEVVKVIEERCMFAAISRKRQLKC